MIGSIKMKPSKTKFFEWMLIPIIHSIIYHYQKEKKSFLQCKSHWGSWSFRRSSRVLFRFLSDGVFLRVLSDRIFFESSVIGSSSGSSVIDSSIGPWVLFFRHAAIFYQNVLLIFFLLKVDVLFYITFSKRTLHLKISSKKYEEILA